MASIYCSHKGLIRFEVEQMSETYLYVITERVAEVTVIVAVVVVVIVGPSSSS